MYEIRLINPLRQFGTVYWTLVFKDLTGTLPDLRVDKKFSTDATVSEMTDDIRQTLAMLIYEVTSMSSEVTDDDNVSLPGTGLVVDLSGHTVQVDDVGGINTTWQI